MSFTAYDDVYLLMSIDVYLITLRSWYAVKACEVSHTVIERQVAALVDSSRMVNGKPTSLLDLGYSSIGIVRYQSEERSKTRILCKRCAIAPQLCLSSLFLRVFF